MDVTVANAQQSKLSPCSLSGLTHPQSSKLNLEGSSSTIIVLLVKLSFIPLLSTETM